MGLIVSQVLIRGVAPFLLAPVPGPGGEGGDASHLMWLAGVVGLVVGLITLIGAVITVALAFASVRAAVVVLRNDLATHKANSKQLETKVDAMAASMVQLGAEERESRHQLETRLVKVIGDLAEEFAGWRGELRQFIHGKSAQQGRDSRS